MEGRRKTHIKEVDNSLTSHLEHVVDAGVPDLLTEGPGREGVLFRFERGNET